MTRPVSRRGVIAPLTAAGVLLPWLGRRALAKSDPLAATPGQGEGPFYPQAKPAEHDGDLVHRAGAAPAKGDRLVLGGRVRDAAGRPVAGARVEIWQCDHRGIYRHPRAANRGDVDPGFQGFGEVVTNADGGYRFLTLVPVPYPGRPPHIHVKVFVGGTERLTTQLYLKDHPENDRDGLLSSVFFPDKDQLMLSPRPIDPVDGAAAYKAGFDFVV